jgi:signal peptidase I
MGLEIELDICYGDAVMRIKTLIWAAGILVVMLVVAGGVYAWRGRPSDVSRPQPTPDSNLVRYHVVGTSMDPTIKDGDWLLARTDVKTVQRGNLVVMRYPKDETKVYCRRVIAVGGDKVVMKYYSNVKLTTVFTPDNPQGSVFPAGVTPVGNPYGEYDATVDMGSYYVVGDNTVPGGSYDSDEWGLLPQADVAGVVTERTSPDPRKF